MNVADTQPARLLTIAGICRATGADYCQVTQAIAAVRAEPELVIDDKPLFGRAALNAVREHLEGKI